MSLFENCDLPHLPARPARKPPLVAAALLILLAASGCRSRFVATTIENATDHPLQMVELDYPGASFGVSTLAPHAVYSYRFKAIGSGALTLTYIQAPTGTHTSTGPTVNDGQGGSLTVHIHDHGAVTWEPALTPHQ